MGERTQWSEQELWNLQIDDTVSPPRVVVGTGVWDGSKWVAQSSGLGLPAYDYVSLTISPSTTETYVFKQGGSGGTTVATVVIEYTDATRATMVSVTKT